MWHRWECARLHLERYAHEGVDFWNAFLRVTKHGVLRTRIETPVQ